MKKTRKIYCSRQPSKEKTVKCNTAINYISQKFLLDFSLIDSDHKIWGFENLDIPKYQDLIKKLSDFCGMLWQEILDANGGKSEGHGNNNHDCGLDKFCKKAHKRLEELHMEDIDNLFSLRLSGKVRIYGIREHNIFKPVWYDQYHGSNNACLN